MARRAKVRQPTNGSEVKKHGCWYMLHVIGGRPSSCAFSLVLYFYWFNYLEGPIKVNFVNCTYMYSDVGPQTGINVRTVVQNYLDWVLQAIGHDLSTLQSQHLIFRQ